MRIPEHFEKRTIRVDERAVRPREVDRIARPRWYDGGLSSQWSQIQRELRIISDVYGFRYNGGYGRDDDYRRRDGDYRRDDDYRRRGERIDDWMRRIPFPR